MATYGGGLESYQNEIILLPVANPGNQQRLNG